MINTTNDFRKNVGSNKAAQRFVNKFSRENGVSHPTYTYSKYGRTIHEAWGENELFSFRYNGESKYISITYKDGRGSDSKVIKYPFFIVWVEGLSPESGEKISKITDEGFEYTTKMSKALRILKEQRMEFEDLMRENGIADWVISSSGTFCPSSYAPSGTLYLVSTCK